MSDTDTEKSWSRLEVGRRVAVSSLEKQGGELPSKITKISSQQFDLESTRSSSGLPFQEGEAIRVKYTEDGVLYCWDGKVEEVSGQKKQTATFTLTGVGVTIHKRKSARVKVSIPFAFMIFDADHAGIIGDQLLEATTRNISVSGLSFTSDLPLKVGDQLKLSIKLPTQSVGAIWLGRSIRTKRRQNRSSGGVPAAGRGAAETATGIPGHGHREIWPVKRVREDLPNSIRVQ